MRFLNFPFKSGVFFPTGSINFPYLAYNSLPTIPLEQDRLSSRAIPFYKTAHVVDWSALTDDERVHVCLNDNSVVRDCGEVYQVLDVPRTTPDEFLEHMCFFQHNQGVFCSALSRSQVNIGGVTVGDDYVSQFLGEPVTSMMATSDSVKPYILASTVGGKSRRIYATELFAASYWYVSILQDTASRRDVEHRRIYSANYEAFAEYFKDTLEYSGIFMDDADDLIKQAWSALEQEDVCPNSYLVEYIYDLD